MNVPPKYSAENVDRFVRLVESHHVHPSTAVQDVWGKKAHDVIGGVTAVAQLVFEVTLVTFEAKTSPKDWAKLARLVSRRMNDRQFHARAMAAANALGDGGFLLRGTTAHIAIQRARELREELRKEWRAMD